MISTVSTISTRRLGAALVCLLGCAVQVYMLALHETLHVEANGDHRVLLAEFGGGVPIAQTFTMRNGGLNGIRVRLAAAEGHDIAIDWVLSERRASEAFTAVRGNRMQVRTVGGETPTTILFPPISESSGRTYRLELRLGPHSLRQEAPGGAVGAVGPVGIVASLDDAMPEGFLTVGGEDRWGDLVFDTLAIGGTIVGRARLAIGLDRSSWFVLLLGAALALYNLLLAAFVWHFWQGAPANPQASTAPDTPSPGDDRRRFGVGQVVVVSCLVVAAGVAITGRPSRASIDLIEHFHEAEIHSSLRMHDAFALMDLAVAGESKRAIFAHSTSEIRWTLMMPSRARLQTSIAIDPGVWSRPGDGVVFRISVSEDGRDSEVFVRHLDPARVPAERRWVPVDLDLSQFSGRRMSLIFKTDASLPGRWPDTSSDWARWGEPRIVTD